MPSPHVMTPGWYLCYKFGLLTITLQLLLNLIRRVRSQLLVVSTKYISFTLQQSLPTCWLSLHRNMYLAHITYTTVAYVVGPSVNSLLNYFPFKMIFNIPCILDHSLKNYKITCKKSHSSRAFQQYQQQPALFVKKLVFILLKFLWQNYPIFNNSCIVGPSVRWGPPCFGRSQHDKTNKQPSLQN